LLTLALAAGFSLSRAEEVTKEAEQELLLQQEKQKQIQAETDYLVRRMATMLRVLEFYQVDKAQEKKLMEEMVGVLSGLSKNQMKEVIRRLDAAAKEKEQGKSDKELVQAYARHREILDALKEMTARFDAVRSLDQAADRLEKFAKSQFELHLQTAQLLRDLDAFQKPNTSATQRLLITKRLRNLIVETKRQADDQSDLEKDVAIVVKQT